MKSTVMQNLVTQFFSVDHERLDFLFRMYQKNKQNQRYKAVLLFDKFSEGMKRHIRWEEELLFPMFDAGADSCCIRAFHISTSLSGSVTWFGPGSSSSFSIDAILDWTSRAN